ncbi:MAG: folate-binding protein YgfZ [Thermoanaerobaculia bacterium]|nr:folate-binding protein YgfZ [Thermoanaerobaculia bacterium]MBP9825884.1 folate-binding protein YgfZ [Thermoanaerobaculia bacterium]
MSAQGPLSPPSAEALAADLAALREGAAVVERAADLLELTGPDRLRLLNGLVTADVKTLAPGTLARGFFTTGQGKILADFRLLALEERCVLVLPVGSGEAIRVHLEKYKVASRVEMAPVRDRRLFELRGPKAGEVMAAATGLLAAEIDLTIDAPSGRSFLLPEASTSGEMLMLRLRAGTDCALREVSPAAVEIDRVENGELLFGVDFSGENFPQETGREADVSYTKGCYLGQEVVARIHYRGGVQRLPRGLRFGAGRPPAAGTELLLDGRAVGRATSVASSPDFGAIGLGLLHQRGAAPGTLLEVAGGGGSDAAAVAEVVELPFGPAQKDEAG